MPDTHISNQKVKDRSKDGASSTKKEDPKVDNPACRFQCSNEVRMLLELGLITVTRVVIVAEAELNDVYDALPLHGKREPEGRGEVVGQWRPIEIVAWWCQSGRS